MKTVQSITSTHSKYPPLLSSIHSYPKTLYWQGDLEILRQPLIAVVGSRAMTRYGQQVCEYIVRDLCQTGIGIVSGLATGIDAAAHRTALDCGGVTVAVLAHGINDYYTTPAQHIQLAKRIVNQGGVLISEHPPETKALRHFFPMRNRIIAGISLGTVVIEAQQKSGALITARLALESGREVFAVPGSIFSSRSIGTLHLIQQGAQLVTNARDIITNLPLDNNALNTISTTQQFLACNPVQLEIISALETVAASAEYLSKITQLPTQQLLLDLTDLEIKGIVRRNIDYTYSLVA